METGNPLRARGGRAAVAALTLALLAWPSLGSAGHSYGRWTEAEPVGRAGCAWIEEGLADDAETRSLCGCGDVIVTVTEEAGSVEWQEVTWVDDGDDGGSSGGSSGGGSTSGSSGTSASGTSASSTSASSTSGGSTSASGTSGGSTSASSTSASGTSASSASGGTSASGTSASGTSASGGSYGQDGSGDGGRSWVAQYLPWLLVGLGILVLALLLALKRSRGPVTVGPPQPAYEPPSDPDSYTGQDKAKY